jgi:hypothetical protein
MKPFLRLAIFGVAIALPCAVESAPEPDKYALVAAMGDRFIAGHEVTHTGSRLPAWRKRPLEVEGDGINKIVLASLDTVVAKMHPGSERIYFSVPLSKSVQDRTRSLEENAFEVAVGALRANPNRGEWHRIVLITPSNRVMAEEGLAADTQGMGLFTQGLCQSDIRDCDRRRTNSGVEVTTPKGEKLKADRFVAPYFFAKIWILDPVSLAVLDTEVVTDHAKYGDPDSDAMNQNAVLDRKFLTARIVQQVETSTAEAVKRSELRGTVEVNERGEAKPK